MSRSKPPRTSLLPEEYGRIEHRLRDGALKDLGIDDAMIEPVLAALQSENFAKALGDLKLGKMVGFVKAVLREANQ